MSIRVLAPGDLVRLGRGSTVWEVVEVWPWYAPADARDPLRLVRLRSTRSGISRHQPSRDLVWADTGAPVDGHPVPGGGIHPDDAGGPGGPTPRWLIQLGGAKSAGLVRPLTAGIDALLRPSRLHLADALAASTAADKRVGLLAVAGHPDVGRGEQTALGDGACHLSAEVLAAYLTSASAIGGGA